MKRWSVRRLGVVLVATIIGAAAVVATSASASPSASRVYVDPAHRFHLTLAKGCEPKAASGKIPDYIECANGYLRIVFEPGGTREPVLQRLVNHVVGDWTGLKLLANNRKAGQMGGLPSRMLFAEGVNERRLPVNVEFIATPKDGGWYALVFVSPANDWIHDSLTYYAPMKASFRFR